MKIKKMSFYAWTLIAAMVISLLPVNAASVKAATTKVLDAGAIFASQGEISFTEAQTFGDFTVTASSAKSVTVKSNELPGADGKELTGIFNFGGSGKGNTWCQIIFETSGKAKVTAYSISTGGDERELALYDFNENVAEGAKPTELATSVIPAKETAFGVNTFEIEKAGKYYLTSTTKGFRIAYVEVTEEGAAAEKPVETAKPAQETQPAQTTSNGNTYTVQKGDTLCAIARKLFNAEAKWADIYNWNKATIKDASLIYIGQVLSINGEAAKPAEETKPSQPTQTTAAEVKNLAVKAEGYHDFATNTRMLKANLTWAAADGVTSYDVYRGAEKVATVNTTSYEDTTAMTDTSVEYAVAAAGAANKTTAKVTSIGYDVTLLQVQKDLDKVEHTPTTAPGYLPVIAQGKKDENLATVYGKDGNKYGFNSETQVGRYRMAEVVAVNWPENDIRAGEALTSKDAPIVFTTEVPNGTYNVYVICCDLDHLYDGAPKHKAVQNISVTGGETVAAEVAENGGYIETKLTAEVTDRKLVVTVSGMEGKEGNGRLNGIIVTSTAK